MKKQIGKNLMQKWKNKIRVRLSALDKKKLVLTNIPYALAAFYADRAFFLYRNSPGEDMGNKLLYAMEHADRIFAGFVLSNNWKDLLEDTGAFARYGVQFDVYYDSHAAASAHGHQTWECYLADDNGSNEVEVTRTRDAREYSGRSEC